MKPHPISPAAAAVPSTSDLNDVRVVVRTGAELLVASLISRGVKLVAGMPGGAALPLYDALYNSPIRHVLARHEQGAAFIAQGQARATGRVGVCLATSGPGATNLITALADARADSIPIVAITGQVPTSLIGTDAFQEADIVAMARPATRAAFQVRDARDIPAAVARAFEIACGGRPGPVLIDIPKDVQQQEVEVEPIALVPSSPMDVALAGERAIRPESEALLDAMAAALFAARRPLLYVGGGVIHASAAPELRRFALRQELPSVASLMGLGAFDGTHELFLGMLGMHGARYTNMALEECDLLLAIGARFDDRATGRLRDFCPRAKILHVDIDAGEIGKLRAVDIGLAMDARQALARLSRITIPRGRPDWLGRLNELRTRYPLSSDNRPAGAIRFFQEFARRMNPADIVTTDVGQHQMWVAQFLPIASPRGLLTSGGLGTMGFGLPAAIGAALARPGARVFCISGDGSILLNIQELATLRETGADVKIIVLNNSSLGMVRQQQALFYEKRYSSSDLHEAPDFVALARSFGIPGLRIDYDSKAAGAGAGAEAFVGAAEPFAFLEGSGPGLLEVRIQPDEQVLPMVPPGRANREMLGAAAETDSREGASPTLHPD